MLSSALPHDYHLWGSEEESPIDTARVPHWSDRQLLVFNHYFQRQKKTHCSTCTAWPWWRLLSCGLLMKSHHPYSFTVGFHKGNKGNRNTEIQGMHVPTNSHASFCIQGSSIYYVITDSAMKFSSQFCICRHRRPFAEEKKDCLKKVLTIFSGRNLFQDGIG